MDQTSQLKVIKAGFIIIRKDDTPSPRIKVKCEHDRETGQVQNCSHEWKTLEKFETKAARDRAYDALLEKDNYIND